MPPKNFKHKTASSEGNIALVLHLKKARLDAGLTKREVVASLGVTPTWVRMVESSKRRLDVVEFVRYCELLGLDPIETLRLVSETQS